MSMFTDGNEPRPRKAGAFCAGCASEDRPLRRDGDVLLCAPCRVKVEIPDRKLTAAEIANAQRLEREAEIERRRVLNIRTLAPGEVLPTSGRHSLGIEGASGHVITSAGYGSYWRDDH